MRNLLVAAAAVIALGAPAAASAQTESVSFSIRNDSSATLALIYYGESSSDEWSDDILQGVIEPGDTVEITVDDGLEECEYDFHYVFDDGGEYTEMNVDMCELDGTEHVFEDAWDGE